MLFKKKDENWTNKFYDSKNMQLISKVRFNHKYSREKLNVCCVCILKCYFYKQHVEHGNTVLMKCFGLKLLLVINCYITENNLLGSTYSIRWYTQTRVIMKELLYTQQIKLHKSIDFKTDAKQLSHGFY